MTTGELTPRAALEALGFRFEPTTNSRGKAGKIVEVHAPRLPNGGGVSWRMAATWPDSPDAAEYVATLLREAEHRAEMDRRAATQAEANAREAEEHAARVRAVAERVKR
jgi:hypothetical protein